MFLQRLWWVGSSMVLLSKLYWSAMHDDPCVCTCGFCDQDCKTIKRLSPSFLMSHMFVPAPFSSLSLLLFCTNGIVYATGTLGTTSIFWTILFTLFFSRCPQQNCFQYRRGTLFSCPKSDMYSTTSFVDYEVWEKASLWAERLQVQLWRACLLLFVESINGCAKGHPIVGIMTPIVVKQLHTSWSQMTWKNLTYKSTNSLKMFSIFTTTE